MASVDKSNESLLDRSQRILGISLDEGEKVKPRTRKSNQSPNRRREQVGAAQRTHRQRTQRYIRELENEVLRLRTLEKAARRKNEFLEQHQVLLIQSLVANNITLPVAPEVPSPVLFDLDDGSFSDSDQASTLINIDITGLETTGSTWACSDSAADRIPPEIDYSMLTPASVFDAPRETEFPSNGTMSSADGANHAILANLDAQAGVDFILALEHPCLPHIKFSTETDLNRINPNLKNHSGPAHVFTATASILHATSAEDPTSHPFLMPQNEISRLLDASKRLNLEEEITPVQVWQKIRDVAATRPISQPLLDAVKADCARFSFCNSFGSVIDKSAVDTIFEYHFPPTNG